MDKQALMEYCRTVYDREQDEIPALYARLPFILSADVLVAGTIVFLLKESIEAMPPFRFDALACLLFACACAIVIGRSIRLLSKAALPVKYPTVPRPAKVIAWRSEYEANLRADGNFTDDKIKQVLGDATVDLLIDSFSSYHQRIRLLNLRRRDFLNSSVRMVVRSLWPLALAAVCYLVMLCVSAW